MHRRRVWRYYCSYEDTQVIRVTRRRRPRILCFHLRLLELPARPLHLHRPGTGVYKGLARGTRARPGTSTALAVRRERRPSQARGKQVSAGTRRAVPCSAALVSRLLQQAVTRAYGASSTSTATAACPRYNAVLERASCDSPQAGIRQIEFFVSHTPPPPHPPCCFRSIISHPSLHQHLESCPASVSLSPPSVTNPGAPFIHACGRLFRTGCFMRLRVWADEIK